MTKASRKARRELLRALDLRYVGEQSSVSVPVVGNSSGWLEKTLDTFHATHERLYGFSVPGEPVELVNVRLRAIGRLYRGKHGRKAAAPKSAPRVASIRQAQSGIRAAKSDRIDVPVYARTSLLPHAGLVGPAIVEQSDSTLLSPAGQKRSR